MASQAPSTGEEELVLSLSPEGGLFVDAVRPCTDLRAPAPGPGPAQSTSLFAALREVCPQSSTLVAAMDVCAENVQMTGFCDDASIPTWAKGYAVSALNAGVVSGVSTAEGIAFRANDAITLNEAAVVLDRLLRVTDVDLSDYDAQDADNAWCAQAVANLQSVSVIESGRFSADEMRSGVTRAQAAEILSAAMTLKDGRAEKGGLLSGIFG